MKTRVVVLRAASVAACLLTLAAACSSSSHGASSATTTAAGPTTSTNVLRTPNSIPFVVGAKVGLPNGWLVSVTKVHRPYAHSTLSELPSDREYVAVDITMDNEGTSTQTVKAADLFSLGDTTRNVDPVVAVPGRPNGIDGPYSPGTTHSGQLVFAVPKGAQLRMAMNGPLIGTQQSIFAIDPPTVPPAD